MENKELVKLAIEAKEKAHVPYSKFRVGAALETEEGKIYQGANIEVSSYSPTICAERVAIFKAVYDGYKKIKKIAITGDSEFTYPCGVCRQVLREFGKDSIVLVTNDKEEYKEYTLDELLPHSFGPEDLKEDKDV